MSSAGRCHLPPRLAVTGGIGAGKSTALAFLRELGAATLSSDDVVHALYTDAEVQGALARRFGDEVVRDGRRQLILSTDGGINVAPTLDQKAQITRNGIAVLHRLGIPLPRRLRRIDEFVQM